MAKTLASLSALVPPPPPPLPWLQCNDPTKEENQGTQSLSLSEWRRKKKERKLKKRKQVERRAARRERRRRREEGLPAIEGVGQTVDGAIGAAAASLVQHKRGDGDEGGNVDDGTREIEPGSEKITEIDAVTEVAAVNADEVALAHVSSSCTSESSDGKEDLELERYTPLKPRERWHPVWGPDARGKLGGPRETHLVVDPVTGKQTLTPEALEQDRMKVRLTVQSRPLLQYFSPSLRPHFRPAPCSHSLHSHTT